MEHDEHEMLIEYSEMTAFNFQSKEYQEVKKDLLKCKEATNYFEGLLKGFIERFQVQAVG